VVKPDPEQIAGQLKRFQGGVADTSTLIYLDGIDLLELSCRVFQLLVPRDVQQEFGRAVPGAISCGDRCTGNADQAVLQLALARGVPLLSEDKRLLMRGRRLGVCSYYNSLMILLALLSQQRLTLEEYQKSYSSLRKIARYSPAVWQVGEHVFSLFVR